MSSTELTRESARGTNNRAEKKRNALNSVTEERTMLGILLVVVLVLALAGALPRWSHSREWGYFPTGGVGLVLLIVVVLLFLGRI